MCWVQNLCYRQPFAVTYVPRPSKPVPVVMDAEGKVDMPMVVRQPTLKVSSQYFRSTFV